MTCGVRLLFWYAKVMIRSAKGVNVRGLRQQNSLKVLAADAEMVIVLHKNLLSKIRVYISNVGFSRWSHQRQRPKPWQALLQHMHPQTSQSLASCNTQPWHVINNLVSIVYPTCRYYTRGHSDRKYITRVCADSSSKLWAEYQAIIPHQMECGTGHMKIQCGHPHA